MITPDERITPQRHLWAPRQKPIRFVEIHSTRGGSTNEYGATKGWMQSPNNNSGGWGGSCSWIIAEDGRLCQVLNDDQMPTYGAGYGGSGSTYAIDEYGIAVEWCQAHESDDFTEAQYQTGAILYADYCRTYGIPPVMLSIPRQVGDVPTGFVRHDRCENGAKLGKSDPGSRFRDDYFLSLVNQRLNPAQPQEDDMSPEDVTKLCDDAYKANPNGSFVRGDGTAAVYKIIDGCKVFLVNAAIAEAAGMAADFSNVKVINAVALNAWPQRESLE